MILAENCIWHSYAFENIKEPGGEISLHMISFCPYSENNSKCGSCKNYHQMSEKKWDIYYCPNCESDLFVPFEREERFTHCFKCGALVNENTPLFES